MCNLWPMHGPANVWFKTWQSPGGLFTVTWVTSWCGDPPGVWRWQKQIQDCVLQARCSVLCTVKSWACKQLAFLQRGMQCFGLKSPLVLPHTLLLIPETRSSGPSGPGPLPGINVSSCLWGRPHPWQWPWLKIWPAYVDGVHSLGTILFLAMCTMEIMPHTKKSLMHEICIVVKGVKFGVRSGLTSLKALALLSVSWG